MVVLSEDDSSCATRMEHTVLTKGSDLDSPRGFVRRDNTRRLTAHIDNRTALDVDVLRICEIVRGINISREVIGSFERDAGPTLGCFRSATNYVVKIAFREHDSGIMHDHIETTRFVVSSDCATSHHLTSVVHPIPVIPVGITSFTSELNEAADIAGNRAIGQCSAGANQNVCLCIAIARDYAVPAHNVAGPSDDRPGAGTGSSIAIVQELASVNDTSIDDCSVKANLAVAEHEVGDMCAVHQTDRTYVGAVSHPAVSDVPAIHKAGNIFSCAAGESAAIHLRSIEHVSIGNLDSVKVYAIKNALRTARHEDIISVYGTAADRSPVSDIYPTIHILIDACISNASGQMHRLASS